MINFTIIYILYKNHKMYTVKRSEKLKFKSNNKQFYNTRKYINNFKKSYDNVSLS